MTNLDSILKSRDIICCQGPSSQSYGFSSSQVQMWELDHKEDWAPKNLCFQTVVLEKTLESPLDSTEIKPVSPKGNQPWIFIGRTDAEAPILWSPDAKSRLIGKDPDAGQDWGQEEKGAMEDEMVGWHHWLNGHEFEQTLGDTEGQGRLTAAVHWGHKESDTIEWLNNTTTHRQLQGRPNTYFLAQGSAHVASFLKIYFSIIVFEVWLPLGKKNLWLKICMV